MGTKRDSIIGKRYFWTAVASAALVAAALWIEPRADIRPAWRTAAPAISNETSPSAATAAPAESAQPRAEASAARTVAIRVLASSTHTPIAGARVVVRAGIKILHESETSEAGGAQWADAGLDWFADVTKEGFLRARTAAAAIRSAPRSPVDVELAPEAALHVRVFDEAGPPVPDAFVEVFPGPVEERTPDEWPAWIANAADAARLEKNYQITSTDSRGSVTIRSLPAGVPLWVKVSGGFLPRKVGARIDAETREGALDVVVAPGCEVVGRVVRASGGPSKRTEVRLTTPELIGGANNEYPSRFAITGDDGEYRFRGIPRAAAHITAVETNGTSADVLVDERIKRAPDLVVGETNYFWGRLASRREIAAPQRFFVSLFADGAPDASATCSRSGEFRGHSALRDATMIVMFADEDGGRGRPIAAESVHLPVENKIIDLDAVAGVLEFTAPQLEHSAADALDLLLAPADAPGDAPPPIKFRTVARNGAAAAGGIPAGDYQLLARHASLGGFRAPVRIAAGIAAPMQLLFSAADVRGTCVDAQGAGVRARVSLEDGAGNKMIVPSGTDGTFIFSAVPSGEWRAKAADPDPVGGLRRASDDFLVVVATRAIEGVRLVLLADPAVEGTVLNAAGAPIEGCAVTLARLDAGGVRDGTTDAAGRFSMENVAPGKYIIGAAPRALAGRSGAFELLQIARGETKTVTLRERRSERRIRAMRGGAPFIHATSARVYESSGVGYYAPIDDAGVVSLGPGAEAGALLVAQRFVDEPRKHAEYYYAYIHGPPAAEIDDVESEAGTVQVDVPATGYSRPTLRVRSIRGISLPNSPVMAESADAPGERVFTNVPNESMLQIEWFGYARGKVTKETEFRPGELRVGPP